MESKILEPELLVIDAHGQYIPQLFLQGYSNYITNKDKLQEYLKDVQDGPDNEHYWDSWDFLLNTMEFINDNGEKMEVGYLEDSCDLWAIPEGYWEQQEQLNEDE
jgi:hypothetical protein